MTSSYSSQAVEAFAASARAMLDQLESFARGLTARDRAMLELGMQAAHMEEALALGDLPRARAHLGQLTARLRELAAVPAGTVGAPVLSLSDLEALAASVGFPNPALAAAVAMAESRGDAGAQCIDCFHRPDGTAVHERSFGLWQINTDAHPQYDEAKLLDPVYNARAALQVSSGGTNWKPWSTYTSGAYLAYYHPPASSPTSPPAPSSRALPALFAVAAAVGLALLGWRFAGAPLLPA